MSDEFQLEPFDPNKYKELGVFEVGDGYWFVGYDLESCIKEAVENYDVIADEGDTRLLTQEQMESLKIYDCESGETHTMLELFLGAKKGGGEFPRLLACEDW